MERDAKHDKTFWWTFCSFRCCDNEFLKLKGKTCFPLSRPPLHTMTLFCWFYLLLIVPARIAFLGGSSQTFLCAAYMEIEGADQNCHLNQSHYTSTEPASLSTDPIMAGVR